MIAIPPAIYRALGWAQGSWLSVRREGSEIVISHLHLGQSPEVGDKHIQIPAGKHGKYFRRENEERQAASGKEDTSPSEP